MNFPSTPKTLLGRLKNREMPRLWENSWEEFFDLYHEAVRVCVAGAFRRNGWHDVPEQDLQDLVLRVFEQLYTHPDAFDPERGRFRQFLATLCHRRVVDFLRTHMRRDAKNVPLETAGGDALESGLADYSMREDEAFRRALLGTLLAAVRQEISPRTFLMFERVKLHGESPDTVASDLGVGRGVVDNTIYKAMQKLREISLRPEIQQEL